MRDAEGGHGYDFLYISLSYVLYPTEEKHLTLSLKNFKLCKFLSRFYLFLNHVDNNDNNVCY